jgi:hypothetical protein
MESDSSYFARRALEERSAARRAADRRARDAHRAIAKSYEERAHAAEAQPAH